mmetsp:Transcript_28001/g.73898  ORF Transcript_28001/g.73898 Transcript_28001/m.73898 type:complete len:89 (-) Transcript_28001:15-281(-)
MNHPDSKSEPVLSGHETRVAALVVAKPAVARVATMVPVEEVHWVGVELPLGSTHFAVAPNHPTAVFVDVAAAYSIVRLPWLDLFLRRL